MEKEKMEDDGKGAFYCEQCGVEMNAAAWYCGPVCGKCCRKNHKKVVGK